MSKSNKPNLEELEREHRTLYPKSETLCTEAVRQIQHLIDKEQITLAVPIQKRPKTWASINEKIESGRFRIKSSILELQDLAGLRIIALFQRDTIRIESLIESIFEPIKKYKTDEKLEDNQFGYSSTHLVVKVPQRWANLPTFSDLKDIQIEIQIRTLSQHSWAKASNILQYKKEQSVPKPLKRSISRISALLETVDLEFERMLFVRDSYLNQIQSQPEQFTSSKLNVDLLKEILIKKLPAKFQHGDEDYDDLLENLKVLKFDTVDSITNLIDKHLDKALGENSEMVFNILTEVNGDIEPDEPYSLMSKMEKKKLEEGVFLSFTGLVRTMLTHELGESWNTAVTAAKAKLE